MTTTESTTIQISKINRDLLDDLGKLMQERHPEIWGERPPVYNAIVGYATAHVVRDLIGESNDFELEPDHAAGER